MTSEQRPVCSKCQTPMVRYNVPHTGDKEQAWRLACSCKHSAVSEVVPSKTVTPSEIRLAVEWLAANANGVSLVDWEPRSQTLLIAADQIEAMASVGIRQERKIERLTLHADVAQKHIDAITNRMEAHEKSEAKAWAQYRELKAQMRQVETSAVPSHEALADHLKTLTASTNCPVCGKSGMHEHTPTELIIYRNGVKYGRSLYETAPVGTPRIGQCEATVPPKWHTPEHRCEFEATTEINGQKLCGHHLKSLPLEPTLPQAWPNEIARAGFNELGLVSTKSGAEKATAPREPTAFQDFAASLPENGKGDV